MGVGKLARGEASKPTGRALIRKTRLVSKGGVMLVRVEVFQDDVLRSTAFKVVTAFGGQTFTMRTKAIAAFRAAARSLAEAPLLKAAA